jgi:hypothetical protein
MHQSSAMCTNPKICLYFSAEFYETLTSIIYTYIFNFFS